MGKQQEGLPGSEQVRMKCANMALCRARRERAPLAVISANDMNQSVGFAEEQKDSLYKRSRKPAIKVAMDKCLKYTKSATANEENGSQVHTASPVREEQASRCCFQPISL